MKQFEPFGGWRAASAKFSLGNAQAASRDRPPRSLGKDVGAAHRPQIANESIEIGISDINAVDIDHRLSEADRGQQGGQRWSVDARVKVWRCTALHPIGGKHRGAQARQAVASDDCPN